MKENKYKCPLTGKALLAIEQGALRSVGYSLSDLISAGYSASDLEEVEDIIKNLPKLVNPYSQLWKEIQEKKRCHQQSTWGPEEEPKNNICGKPMCTAGHLVNMSGKAGYELKNKTSWRVAAELIHRKAHPDIPSQNFGSIQQELALEYIKQMAEYEESQKEQ
ncbi:MAG: hypothetical protein HC875_38215 [Anaerolineales bacterium]|nr:hypothetical protein [Anaerolineales bacterium]